MSDERLDGADVQRVMFVLQAAARALATVPLDQYLADVDHANTVAPIFNPTLWMRGEKSMNEWADLARAALPLWRIGRQIEKARALAESKAGAR